MSAALGLATPATPAGSIAGVVFDDPDVGRVQRKGDAGLAGVLVYLDGNNNGKPDPGEPVARTDAAGRYAFAGLAPGTYKVRQVPPAGFPYGDSAVTARVKAGHTVSGANFGDTDSARVSGVVYDDANGDGKQDHREPGLPGWAVTATGPAGKTYHATTNDAGYYRFEPLPAGSYSVTLTLAAGFALTKGTATQRVGTLRPGRTADDRDFAARLKSPGVVFLSESRSVFIHTDIATYTVPPPTLTMETKSNSGVGPFSAKLSLDYFLQDFNPYLIPGLSLPYDITADAAAMQSSLLTPQRISVSGSASALTNIDPADVTDANPCEADSNFDVTFRIDAPLRYDLSTSWSGGSNESQGSGFCFQKVGGGFVVDPALFGDPAEGFDIHQKGVLSPGTYRLTDNFGLTDSCDEDTPSETFGVDLKFSPA